MPKLIRRTGAAFGLIAAFFLVGALALAGDVYRGTGVGDVIVATVKKASTPGTNGQPPTVVLEVHEVLRGDPKSDRSQGIVEPSFHGVDWGVVETNPLYLRWRAQPLAPPKPGTKWVMWGDLAPVDAKQPKGAQQFHLNPYHQYEFSDKRRAWAIDDIKATAAARQAAEELRAADAQRLRGLLRNWRNKFDAQELDRLTRDADLIVVGKIVSGSATGKELSRYELQVSQLLKGELRAPFKAEASFVGITVPTDPLGTLIDPRDRAWIVFLSTAGRKEGVPDYYQALDDNRALVEADETALQTVREALKKAKF